MRSRSAPLLLARLSLFLAEKGFSAAASLARIAREVLEEPAPSPPAEEGARAEVHVDEPWDGYRNMTATDIRARLAGAEAEVAAAVKLYEATHKQRSSVIDAADRRLRG